MGSRRVYYAERQRLAADDLRTEQEYLAGLDQRHRLRQHTPGVVRGLRLGEDLLGRPAVEPGLAVDEFGRELLLQEYVPFKAEGPCADVWLIYCCDPPRPRPDAPCAGGGAPRSRETPLVLVETTEEKDAPQPPAEGAVFLGRLECKPPEGAPDSFTLAVPCTSPRGGEVRDPGGRASMQVGPRTGRDPVGFAVSTAGDPGTPARRFALRRRGGNVIDATVELVNYRARAVLWLFNDTVRLLVESRIAGPAGERIEVQTEQTIEEGKEVVNLTFLSPPREAGLPRSEGLTLTADKDSRSAAIANFNRDEKTGKPSRLVRLEEHAGLKPPVGGDRAAGEEKDGGAGAGQKKDEEDAEKGRALSLIGAAGTLVFDALPKADVKGAGPKLLGCSEGVADREPGGEPMGLSFFPPVEPPKGPPLPRIYLAKVPDGDRTIEQLRFDLGEKKDSDNTERLSVRGQNPPPPPGENVTDYVDFKDWLTVNGQRQVEVKGFTVKEADGTVIEKKRPVSLIVKGTFEQAALKPDATDPLFRQLLAIAWLAGLRSAARVATDVLINPDGNTLPKVVESNTEWEYNAVFTNNGPKEVTIRNLVETLKVKTSGGEEKLFIRVVPGEHKVGSKASVPVRITHKPEEMPEGDMTFRLDVAVDVDGVTMSQSGPAVSPVVKVVPRPTPGSPDKPHAVPPGVGWSYTFKVKNNSGALALTLKRVVLTEKVGNGGPVVRTLLAADTALQPTFELTLGPVAHPGGIAQTLKFNLDVTYEWKDDKPNNPKTVSLPGEVKVVKPPEVEIEAPGEIGQNQDWAFEVTIRNIGRVENGDPPVTITAVSHKLSKPPGAEPTPVTTNLPQVIPASLGALWPVAGTRVATAGGVTLEVTAEYSSGGVTAQARPATAQIEVIPPPEP